MCIALYVMYVHVMYVYVYVCVKYLNIYINIPFLSRPPGPSQCNYPRCGSDRTVHFKKKIIRY